MAEYLVGASRLMPQGGGSAEQQLAELRDFCRVLLDELSWALSSLGPANFTDRGLAALAERIGAGGNDGVQMAGGQYTGNGNYGESEAIELSFPFAPRLVVIECARSDIWGPLIIHAGVTKTYNKEDSTGQTLDVQWSGDGKALKFWSSSSGGGQMNKNNYKYNWTAFG